MGYDYFRGQGTQADPLLGQIGWQITAKDSTHRLYYTNTLVVGDNLNAYPAMFPESQPISLGSSITVSEREPYHVVGFDGASLLQIPPGWTISTYTLRVIASATSCAIEIRFDDVDSRMEGVCAVIPALAMDLTENAWSEYVYSGQREWEIESRWNESWKKGTESVVSGATTGALMGGIGSAGAGLGAVAGSISGLTSMATDFGWYNESTKKLKDDLMSRQSPGIILQGNPWDTIWSFGTVQLMRMKMDSYSESRVTNEIAEVGIGVDEYPSKFTIPSPRKGFYQVANLIVIGNVPVQARKEIAAMFAKGVRLI